jgi:hypothetical protein
VVYDVGKVYFRFSAFCFVGAKGCVGIVDNVRVVR